MSNTKSKGKVYLVGAGPGDPGLLTLRGKEVISKAEVVVYDALIHPRILGFIPKAAKRIFRGSQGRDGAMSQVQINHLLVRLALQGKKVVRLKGGDPFVFGRGGEEILALAEKKIPFEVVPGVTAAVAVPAYAGIPVTHRAFNASFTVVTGHEDPSKPETQVDWAHLAKDQGTLVFLMGLHTLPDLCRRLITEGKGDQTPAAVIQWGTTSRQKTVLGTLQDLPQLAQRAGLKPPATVVVGPVVSLAPKLEWISQKPLWGFKVLVTRTPAKSSYLSGLLAEEGAEVIEIPTIDLKPLKLNQEGLKLIRLAPTFDWIIFASTYAVEIFMEQLAKVGLEPKVLRKVKFACVGEATAKTLKTFGIKSNLVPKDYKQEGLVLSFQKLDLRNKKIMFVGAKEGRGLLIKFLKKKKAFVKSLALYENLVPVGAREQLRQLFIKDGGVDLVTFASSSSVDHFYSLFTPAQRRQWLRRLPVAVIGPVTGATVRKWGGKPLVQPQKYTLPALVEAIGKWAKRRRPLIP